MTKDMAKAMMIAAIAFVAGILLTYSWLQKETGFDIAIDHRSDQMAERDKQPLYWVAPMDPNYRRDQAGKSPMGMDLIPFYKETVNEDAPGTVKISSTVANNLGVQLGEAVIEDLSLRVPTVGFIQFDEESISHSHSRVEGWISSLAVTSVGDSVEKGQQLFELYSPELVNAQEEYVASLAAKDKRLLNGAKGKLKALGVADSVIEALTQSRQVKQRLPFFAPSTGYISMLKVREGMFVEPSTEMLAVGSLQQVWVIAEVFERQAAWVKPGQQVRMSVESYPGEHWVGRVDYLYPVLDAQTRTLRARIVFDNQDESLKPNMFAQLVIEAGTREQVLSIPREAVIYQGGMSRVVLVTEGNDIVNRAKGSRSYRSVRVKTGIESGDRIEITAGLEAGDQVVVSSQFLIDSESSVSAELSRIDGALEKSDKPDPHQQ